MVDNLNLSTSKLVELALQRQEGILCDNGALCVHTGGRTGRSANDKFIVKNSATVDSIAWGEVNRPISQEVFNALWERVSDYLDDRETYTFQGYAGVRPNHARDFLITCELASQALFASTLLRVSDDVAGEQFLFLVAPGFICDPDRDSTNSDAAIMLDFESKRALIAGTAYSGEIKKLVFTVMNFLLPRDGVLPMHCAANSDRDGKTAVFFGLSGTGKTTLSADPRRLLIGDDEHGWADDGIFNFEAGCYAKCINLDPKHEPEIYNAIKFEAIVENVVVDEKTRAINYADSSITENTRAAYPVTHIANIEPSGEGQTPSTVIFLTADAFGVLPAISKLSIDQAMYYFLSGYTSKVAGTEMGIDEPVPTFSTCFGEPFLPLNPSIYADMLKEKIIQSGADVFLINTGWNGRGERMPLAMTRAMVDAAIAGKLRDCEYAKDPIFCLSIPATCPGCPSDILDPRSSWESEDAWKERAEKLAKMFQENFNEKYASVSADIEAAGPHLY